MANETNTPPDGNNEQDFPANGEILPESPALALFAAGVFLKLGGSFFISQDGRRMTGQVEWGGSAKLLPQIQTTRRICDQFHSGEEVIGAIKLLRQTFEMLAPSDLDLIYDVCASTVPGLKPDFDFREHLS